MTTTRDVYWQNVQSQIPRLLGLMDRNPFSPTFGSFHRSFWLHRTSDFSSSAMQMGVHTLAMLWSASLPANSYKDNPQVLKWIIGGLLWTTKIQKGDGSFDEWYPEERGWAGPTAYVLYALVRTYYIVEKHLSENEKERLLLAFEKGARHLAKYEETDILANHQAIALLALKEIELLTGKQWIANEFEVLWHRFEKSCSDEGWSLEYDGADPGYQTATVSFLARLHRIFPDKKIEKIVEKQLDFISYFFYPDGGFAGTIGSRSTYNVFFLGFEYWSKYFPLAKRLALEAKNSLAKNLLLRPCDQEDHYLIYRLPEFIESYIHANDNNVSTSLLPYEQIGDYEKIFNNAGLLVRKYNDYYFIFSKAKAGAFKLFSITNKRLILSDSGWVIELVDGKRITNSWMGSLKNQELLVASGRGVELKTPVFNPFKFVLFRILMCTLAWHPKAAQKLKSLIRNRLMVGRKEVPVSWLRKIEFSDNSVVCTDKIILERFLNIKSIWYGGDFASRVVPQSRYFHQHELKFSPVELSKDKLSILRQSSELEIIRRIE